MRLPASTADKAPSSTAPLLTRAYMSLAAAAAVSLGSGGLIAAPAPAAARILTKAPDTEDGARVFAYVCSACHLGGYNQVRYEKTLQEAVLRENGMLAADAIEYQVTNGKNRMPGAHLTARPSRLPLLLPLMQSETRHRSV